MNDLDILRPEVREAWNRIVADEQYPEDFECVEAELLRLADENADYGKHAIEQYKRGVYWMDRAKEAEAELAALKARAQWQPIETAPKDGTAVLLYEPDESPPVNVAQYGIGSWYLCAFDPGYDLTQRDVHPTHWMPQPEPPAERGRGER